MTLETMNILSVEKITEEIEELVWKHDLEYIEAVIQYCRENNIEVETLGEVVKKSQFLFSKIEEEAEVLSFIPKKTRLPF